MPKNKRLKKTDGEKRSRRRKEINRLAYLII